MSDFKSKLPDLKELGQMTGKLLKDLKTSIGEIVDDYKKKHPDQKPESTEEQAPGSTPSPPEPEEKTTSDAADETKSAEEPKNKGKEDKE